MTLIDKIIFNRLLARESVSLPEVGALISKEIPAKLVAKNRLSPPQWKVVLSGQHEGVVSIIDVIVDKSGVSYDDAVLAYNQWLAVAKNGNKCLINGVGTISNDFFTLDQSLATLINPLADRDLIITKRKSRLLPYIGVVALIAILASVGYVVYDNLGSSPSEEFEVETIAWQGSNGESSTPITEIDDTMNVSVVVAEVIETQLKEDSITIPTTQSVGDSSQNLESSSVKDKTPTTTYYLVVGLYSNDKNADKFIAQFKEEHSSLTLSKVPFGKGKILISAYSSTDHTLVKSRKIELESTIPGIWIHKKNK